MGDRLPRSLSQTEIGERWLDNFESQDRNAALRLLDGIEVVSRNSFSRELTRLLDAETQRVKGPLALLVVRSLEASSSDHYLGCGADSVHLNQSTSTCPDLGLEGSSLLVKHVVEKWAKTRGALVEPTIGEMRVRRVRHLFLVTDTSVSGDEVARFVNFVSSNPSVRSWVSYGLLKLTVVTHSSTEAAIARIGRKIPVKCARLAPTISSSDWSCAQRAEIESVCRDYARGRGDPLGWGGAGLLCVYEHSFGNGTPEVLRQGASRDNTEWHTLLPHGRGPGLSPAILSVAADYRPSFSVAGFLASLSERAGELRPRGLRSATAVVGRLQRSPNERALVILLSVIASGHTRELQIMAAGRMSSTRFQELTRLAHDHRLIAGYDDFVQGLGLTGKQSSSEVQFRLTRAGRRVVARYGRRAYRGRSDNEPGRHRSVAQVDDYYYPRSLR